MVTMLFRANVRDEHAADVDTAVRKLFAAIDQAAPEGVRYTSYRLADGGSYVIVLELLDESANPLQGITEFREFQDNLKGWLAAPAIPERLIAVGEYRSF
jgi:hypothetical protein